MSLSRSLSLFTLPFAALIGIADMRLDTLCYSQVVLLLLVLVQAAAWWQALQQLARRLQLPPLPPHTALPLLPPGPSPAGDAGSGRHSSRGSGIQPERKRAQSGSWHFWA